MDLRVVLLCIVAAYGQSPDYEQNYKSGPSSDLRAENTNSVPGFVQPLDFTSFTQQFFAGSQNILAAPFAFGSPEVFGAESKKTGVFQTANSDFVPFSGSPFPEDVKANNTGFVQPVHFVSPFERDGSNTKIYSHQRPPNASLKKYSPIKDPMHKAETGHGEENEEVAYTKHIPTPSRQSYKQNPKLASLKRDHFGKSSYPSPQSSHKSEHSPSADSPYYLPKHKDVEVFLPKEKLTVLPMVNGRPKPYDGYRAASEVRNYDNYESDDEEDDEDSSGRYSEAEIIYGKPKPGPQNIVPPYIPGRSRIKRSPAEYHGGIYPHYDYSDPKHNKKLEVKETEPQKKLYPKKQQPEPSEKPYDQYKYPKANKKVKDKDNYGHATEENTEEYKESEDQSEEQQEQEQEQEPEQEEQGQEQGQEQEQEQEDAVQDIPPITYQYDNEFNIPELKVKRYPYETFLKKSAAAAAKDSKRAASKDNERSSSNYDEFTADYESYKKTLPSDLEKYFGSPDFEERYTVAATENLEKNKNCQKINKIVTPQEIATGKAKREVGGNDNQVCYICTDPNTGGSFEQCAYQTDPKSEKFFHGGSSSYKSSEKTEPITYRYRRSPFNDDHFSLEHFIFGDEPHAARTAREDHEYVPKPKKTNRKKYKKPPTKNKAKSKYDGPYKKYGPQAKILGASSTYADESARVEGRPESYNGPAYTYEGPSSPYEGPKETYEGPAVPYEGPAEPYEGPISQEYYDLTDDRLKDDDDFQSKQESQSTAPKENTYYNKEYQKQSKPRGYSVKHVRPQRGPKSEVEEFPGGNYRAGTGFIADYRFGPEHFHEDEEVEPTRHNDEVRSPKKLKSTEKRGPHKFVQSEEKTPASSEAEDVGHVRVYKNGDVCQKKKKDGMICMVCLNEKTSASYEQCQYSSKPKDKFYTFGSQKSYSSNKAPSDRHERNAESDQYPEKSDIVEKKILIRKESKIFGDDAEAPESLVGAESRGYDHFREFLLSGDLVGAYSENDETYANQNDTSDEDAPRNTETIERIEPRDEVEGLDEFLYGTPDNDKKATEEDKTEYKNYDDYFSSLFPDFAKNSKQAEGDSDTEASFDPFENIREFKVYEPEEHEEIEPVDVSDSPKRSEASNEEPVRLKDQGSRLPTDFFEPYSEEHKKDLEKALGEFQNKDWSNCKKIVKNKLTCYQCLDKHGVSNEECMYVESSQPVSKHLAYHEKKELRPEVPTSKEEAESQKNEQSVAPTTEKITTEPNRTNEETYKRIRKPKNSRPEIIEVSEAPQEDESNISTKGDLEGLSRINVEEITFTTTVAPDDTYRREPEVTTQKPRIKKNRKNQKKRIKSKKDGNETSTAEVTRKRKYPIKKFGDQDREILSDDSSNPNAEESSRVINEDDASVVKIFFNNTEGSAR